MTQRAARSPGSPHSRPSPPASASAAKIRRSPWTSVWWAPMDGSTDDPLIATLEESRRRFLALVADVRPDLHRYCARMTGSIADGEDVVQDTLARACYELSQMKTLPPLAPWLFRIAHNRAIDHLRREAVRRAEPLEDAMEIPA